MSGASVLSQNLDGEDKQSFMLFQEGDTIRLGMELYEAMFYKPNVTQLRLLFEFDRTDSANLNISSEKSDEILYQNYSISSTRPLDIGFSP